MTLPTNTKIRFFGQKILIESSGDKEIDKALRSAFEDSYWRTGISARRFDVQLLLNWTSQPKEASAYQLALFP